MQVQGAITMISGHGNTVIMTHHSYNDEGICFSKETDLGMIMERKMQVETLWVYY